jgi:heme-degrading monooxygenase HmoA
MTTDDYDEVSSSLPAHQGDGSEHPVVAHIAAVGDDGKLYVFDLWESAEAFGAFAERDLAPHAEKMGDVNPTFTPVHNVIRGSAKVTA